MNMPIVSIVMGVLLAAVGVAGAAHAGANGKEIYTPLIPLYFGVIFAALGVGAVARPSLRKHLMHALAALALLGVLGTGGRMISAWSKMSDVARASHAAMTILCALTVGLCVKSFIDARKAREAAALPDAAI